MKKKKKKKKDDLALDLTNSGQAPSAHLEQTDCDLNQANGNPHPAVESKYQYLIVASLFVLSGLSSLIYQVIWTRQLVFVFGSTTFASSTVLSLFMGGLALGAFLAGRVSQKIRKPFFCYGILELLIGAWAFFAPQLFELAIPIYKAAWQQTHMSVLPFSFLRFVVVGFILLPPTACMGATLPLLSRFVTRSLDIVADRVGTLYALNTLGAVCGAILAGFFLIPSFGLGVSTITAACTNILLAAIVCLLSAKWERHGSENGSDPISDQASSVKSKLSPQIIMVLLAFAISGAIAMINEVAWTRALLMVIGSTTYAFSVMLSTFLIGIFTGSFILARFSDRLKDPFFWFAVMQMLLCAAGILSVCLFNYLPYWNIAANLRFYENPEIGMYIRFGLAAIVLVPISVFLGAMFPLAVKTCAGDLDRVGRSVGTLYSANTLGAIIGAASAGFIIIPALGGEQALLCCAVANYLLGFLLLILSGKRALFMKITASIVLVILASWLLAKPEIWDKKLIVTSQRERRILGAASELTAYDEWRKFIDSKLKILLWKDGLCSNVCVAEHVKSKNISLFTNGHVDASMGVKDIVTQAGLATIPLLLRPGTESVAVVGWGSGSTAGFSFLFPIKRLVCAELEKHVLDTAPYFHKINFEAEKDPRLALEFNDGRNYLLATDEKFDLVISEPSNPWQAGVCNLYTKEFFEISKARLNKGGVFALWWQGLEVSEKSLTHVIASLKRTFKHVTVFAPEPANYCALASDDDLRLDLSVVAEALKDKKRKGPIAESVEIKYAADLAAMLCMVDDGIDKATAGAEPNTDDRNFIEFEVSKTYEQKRFQKGNQAWFLQNAGKLWDSIDWKDLKPLEKAEEMAMIAESASVLKRNTVELWAQESFKIFPNVHAMAILSFATTQKDDDFEGAIKKVTEDSKIIPQEYKTYLLRGLLKLNGGAPNRAQEDLAIAYKHLPDDQNCILRYAQSLMPETKQWYQKAIVPIADSGKAESNPKKVLELFSTIEQEEFFVENPQAALLRAAANLKLNPDQGIKLMEAYLHTHHGDSQAWAMLADAYAAKNDRSHENSCRSQAAERKLSEGTQLIRRAHKRYEAEEFRLCLELLKSGFALNPRSEFGDSVLESLASKYPPARELQKQREASSESE